MLELRDRNRPPSFAPRAAFAGALLLAALHSVPAKAGNDVQAIVDKAHWLEERGQLDQAKELLSRVATAEPDSELVALARAEAYLLEKNPFWALKVLGALIEKNPNACSARAFAARVHLQEANLEQAAQMLDVPSCERRDEFRLRFALLRLELAGLKGEGAQVAEQLRRGKDASHRFEEDDRRLSRLARRFEPWSEPSFSFKLDLGMGWASTGLGSVPLDLAWPRARSSSSFLGMDLATRYLPVRFPSWRPVVEVEAHLAQYLEEPTKALSSRQPIWRIGAEIGQGPRRLLLSYSGDVIALDGGSDYPNDSFVYSSGHRFEYRFTLARTLHAYGALGYRQFWQRDRTRIESDHGLSKSVTLSDTVGLAVGGNWHVYKAEHLAYDQFGAGANAALRIALPKGFELRETFALGYDLFPRSERYFDPQSLDRRRDTLVRVGVGLSAPYVMDLRLGVSYGYANRDSTVDAFDLRDHRALFTVTWESDSERLLVRRIPRSGRIPLPYPDDENTAAAGRQVEIIEVIRRDEAQRQNGSCLK